MHGNIIASKLHHTNILPNGGMLEYASSCASLSVHVLRYRQLPRTRNQRASYRLKPTLNDTHTSRNDFESFSKTLLTGYLWLCQKSSKKSLPPASHSRISLKHICKHYISHFCTGKITEVKQVPIDRQAHSIPVGKQVGIAISTCRQILCNTRHQQRSQWAWLTSM